MTNEPIDAGDPIVLSPTGQARKAQMLHELSAAMRGRSIRRRVVRTASLAAPLILLGGLIWVLSPTSRPALPNPVTEHASAPVAPGPRLAITMVATDPDIDTRLAPAPSPSFTRMVTDEELRGLLMATGHDPGFIRTGARVILAGDVHPGVSDEPPPADDIQG